MTKIKLITLIFMVFYSMLTAPILYAQNKIAVIPFFDEKEIFVGLGSTGNSMCTSLNFTTGHWFYTTPSCASVEPALSGQDGEIKSGITQVPRFKINSDGTILDDLTNLIWLKNALCAQITVTWADALASINELNSSGTMNTVDDCGDSANHNDWRLPNVKELQSLVHYGDHGSPYFSNTVGNGQVSAGDPIDNLQVAEGYWSSTTYGVGLNPMANDDFLDNALLVNFGSGETKGDAKAGLNHVWAVRSAD